MGCTLWFQRDRSVNYVVNIFVCFGKLAYLNVLLLWDLKVHYCVHKSPPKL
jgi:hypothetical protein